MYHWNIISWSTKVIECNIYTEVCKYL
uniref:Uncharacterized protein n=1 Tax=Anguilla anguilla TaxID=7936 RepID=A0A0E9UBQ3_ANGAN